MKVSGKSALLERCSGTRSNNSSDCSAPILFCAVSFCYCSCFSIGINQFASFPAGLAYVRTLLGRFEACERPDTTAPGTTMAPEKDPSTTAAEDESKKKKTPVKFDVAVPFMVELGRECNVQSHSRVLSPFLGSFSSRAS